MPNKEDDALFLEFAALSYADRRAVESLLSAKQRQALHTALKPALFGEAPAPKTTVPGRPPQPVVSSYSPWLAKRLTAALEGAGATALAQEALRRLLSAAETAP